MLEWQFIAASIGSIIILALILSLVMMRRKLRSVTEFEVPESIWAELQEQISPSDFNYIRQSNAYMARTPKDLLARLNYLGAVANPSDPGAIRTVILELRVADLEQKLDQQSRRVRSDGAIIWLAVSSVGAVVGLAAIAYSVIAWAASPS